MTVLLTYAAVLLLAVSIMLSRASRRQLSAARKALATNEAALTEAGQALQEAVRAKLDAEQRHTGLDERLEQAQAQVRTAREALDAVRQAPLERYHVFDRMEPRPGALWAVTVARSPDVPSSAPPWSGERTFLLTAASQSEAVERVTLRYPRASGFDLRTAAPCPISFGSDGPRGGKRPRV